MNRKRFWSAVLCALLMFVSAATVAAAENDNAAPAPGTSPVPSTAPAQIQTSPTPAEISKDKNPPATPPAPKSPAAETGDHPPPSPAPTPPPTPAPTPPASTDEIKVDAEIYFSEKDPRWEKDVKPLVDEVEKKFHEIRMNRISIDAPEGREKLAAAEKDHGITERGEITFIFGPFALVSKGATRDVELYMEPMVARLFNPESAKGRLPASAGDYAREIFGKNASAEPISPPEKDQRIIVNKVTLDGKFSGWVVDAYNPIKCPICNDAQFLMAVAPDFKALDVRPVRELERRGRKLDDAEVAKFLSQFKRELPKTEPLKVDGISGATRTTLAYEQAMNAIIAELKKQVQK